MEDESIVERLALEKGKFSQSIRETESGLTASALEHFSLGYTSARTAELCEDVVSSRVKAVQLKLEDYCLGSELRHSVRNLMRFAPWIAGKTGSALTVYMENVQRGVLTFGSWSRSLVVASPEAR